jgi:hypothetical protein
MQAADVGHAIKRLQELADTGPGANREALEEAQAILYRMGSAGGATGYLAEKLAGTKASFETWLSVREWEKYGADPQAFRAILLQDIEKLRKALARGAAGQD